MHLWFAIAWMSLHPDAGTKSVDVGALKAEVRQLIKAGGCKQTSQCKALPMGSRPCGGPSEFLVYCAASTDEKTLTEKANAATEAEKAWNAKSGMMSTCIALVPPKVKLDNGECKPEAPKGTDLPM